MMKDNKVIELFGHSTKKIQHRSWEQIIAESVCPVTQTKCFKVRKSQPDIAIGTCSVCYGVDKKGVIICPNRLLERHQVFMDCLPLLSLHEPGNEFHVVSEVSIPGGSIDYLLVSVRQGKVKDLVAVEFQTLDTTGTLWPERQRFLSEKGLVVAETVLIITGGIDSPPTAQVQIHLEKDRYQRGETFKATLTENLGWGYNLYAAVLFPDGQNFMTLKNTNELRPVNEAKPWYAQRK
jgi:Restriction endonuclease NotI